MNDSERALLLRVAREVRDQYNRASNAGKFAAISAEMAAVIDAQIGERRRAGLPDHPKPPLGPVPERFERDIWDRGPNSMTLYSSGRVSCDCCPSTWLAIVDYAMAGSVARFECPVCHSRGSRLKRADDKRMESEKTADTSRVSPEGAKYIERQTLKKNPEAQQFFVGKDIEFLQRWVCGPNFLVAFPDSMSCQCSGVVEHCGQLFGSELFQCRACGSRGSRLADRDILPEHRAIIDPLPERVDIGAEVPADVAAAIRDGVAHQRERAGVKYPEREQSRAHFVGDQWGKKAPEPPAPTTVQKSGTPGLGRLLDWAFRYRS